MIRFRKKKLPAANPSIDLTPMIDCVFILLIFVVVSATFINENQLRIELPESTIAEGANPQIPIIISIDSNSRLYWQKQQMTTIADLESRIQAQAEPAGQEWVIKADKLTPHGVVIQVFDLLKRNHVRQLSIATDLRPQE